MSQTFSKVATNLPGENAKQLLDRRHRAIPKGVSNGIPTFVYSLKWCTRNRCGWKSVY